MNHSKTFLDYVKIFIKAGNGGSGNVGFRRERFVPKGGPDGGDGGKGGDIIIQATKHSNTLYDFRRKRHHKAQSGEPGGNRQKNGSKGKDLIIKVPPGTLAHDAASGELLGEVYQDQESFTIQKGGRGGLGNMHFKSSTNQTPQYAQTGQVVEGKWVILELKLLADIGIIGFPNAGKSTLLNMLTKAHSKTGDYPFTTLQPHIGVISVEDERIRLADIPGLIEGAAEGLGLGHYFLRHIERAKTLMFLLEVKPDLDFEEQIKSLSSQYRTLHEELKNYNDFLVKKSAIVALSKCDLLEEDAKETIAQALQDKIKNLQTNQKSSTILNQIQCISSQTEQGLPKLLEAIIHLHQQKI